VVSIFAGTNGYLDDIPVYEVSRFEQEFLERMELKHGDFLTEIAEKKELTTAMTDKLHEILKEFTGSFQLSVKAEQPVTTQTKK